MFMQQIYSLIILLLLLFCLISNLYLIYIVFPSAKKRQLASKIKKMKSKFRKDFIYLFDAFFSPFVAALSFVIPKRKDLILFMGRQNSGFLDNVKYLYLYLYEHEWNLKYKIIFVGHNDIALNELAENGFSVVNYKPSFRVYGLLLRAGLIITDNAHWTTHNRYNAALRSHKIQLWHGIGFKKIRLTDEKFKKASKGLRGFITHRLTGQLAIYDAFLSTSAFFTEEVFYPSFLPKEIFISGYPRNDSFLSGTTFEESHIMINVDKETYYRVKQLKQNGSKIVLYAPTFRKAKKYAVGKENLDFTRLSEFGAKHNIYFVFKLHPLPQYKIDFNQFSNVLEYNNRNDVYPLFRYVDLLITDYSSIYMDYLLLDRPCLFFTYDLDYYVNSCRGIREDFMDLAPGAKCFTQDELHYQLYRILIENIDEWAVQRKSIRDLSWEYQGGESCRTTWEYIYSKFLGGNQK